MMENNTMFCPNCGAKITSEDQFCPSCGYDLQQTSNKKTNEPTQSDSSSPIQPTATKSSRTSRQKKMPKWATYSIIALIVVLVGAFIYGENYYKPEKQLARAVKSIQTGKNDTDYFTTSDPNLKITSTSLDPLVEEMNSPKKLTDFQDQLSSTTGTTDDGSFTFKQDGHAWLFFKRYRVYVSPVYAKLSTNHTKVNLSVNNEKIATTTATQMSKKSAALVPGKYKLQANGTVSGNKITNSGNFLVDPNHTEFDLSLKTISFAVKSYAGAKIYLNDEYKATIGDSGSYDFKDIPWSNVMKMQLRYKTKAGTLASDTQPITEDLDNQEITPVFSGVITDDEADNLIQTIFTAVDSVTSSGEESDATDYDGTDLADYFVDGNTNPQYEQLIKMAKGYYDDDDINSVSYDTEIKRVVPNGKESASITYNVEYDFANADADGDHIQVFQYTATVVKSSQNDIGYQIKTIGTAQKVSDRHEDD